MEASEIIPAEEEDDDEYVEKGVSKEPTASAEVLEEEENRDAQCIERSAHELCEQMEVHRRRAENRRRSEAWRSRPRETVSRKLASARATLVGVIAVLTASLSGLARVEGI